MIKETSHAKFIITAVLPEFYPQTKNKSGQLLPEIAVVGRSNVGKSSLLNHLFQAKHLVKTSSTPGKTQALNFFSFNDEISFADLPGYGYAKVPHAIKKQWGPMIRTYLETRENLKVILFLLDIRRIPNEEDQQLMNWIATQEKAVILVLTKADKVLQRDHKANIEKIISQFTAANLHYVLYSVPKSRGRKELLAMMREALRDESQ